LVKETNRIPGGIQTIKLIIQEAHLDGFKKVLEIGTSTGVTACDIANLSACQVTGVDINEMSLSVARERAEKYQVAENIEFKIDDATNLSFKDESFDVVICGNVTSLVSDPQLALAEYRRVLKPGGLLVTVPMYYVTTPGNELLADVSSAIQVDVKPLNKDYWIDFYNISGFVRYSCVDFKFDFIEDDVVSDFNSLILRRPHLADLAADTGATLNKIYQDYMLLFRDNLSIMGYSVYILRKEFTEGVDPELFTSVLI
jgi:SAM-dependent methyltransferase